VRERRNERKEQRKGNGIRAKENMEEQNKKELMYLF
jgi:hypothetical protein